ncbi:terminase small subunit [Microcystis phage vB_MweS-yong2]|nr:terminase small subunit [Microcystis phage vB_MweS-yong2]
MTDVDASVYMTAAQIAERDGVSRQAVSKHVARLVERHALDVKRDGSGRVMAINVAHYDRLLNRFGDSAQRRRPPPAATPTTADAEPAPRPLRDEGAGTLDQARIKKLAYDTELQRLALDEMRGRLVRHDLLVEALQRLGEEIARAVDLTQFCDDFAAAFARNGAHGLRVELKRRTVTIRTALADQCAALALAAPTSDPAAVDAADLPAQA